MKTLFYKGAIDRRNGKALWTFLKEHFTYHTLNSWNGLKSIANNVKIYNLNLEGDKWLALSLLESDNYDTLNSMIYDWEAENPYYEVGFTGRSGGYLILTEKHKNTNILPDWIIDVDTYEDFKENCKDYYGSVKEALDDLNEYVDVVMSFDRLCDEIRDYVNELSLSNKDKMLEDELEGLVERFNENYEYDLGKLQVDELKVEKDNEGYYIDTEQLNKSNALMDCFDCLVDGCGIDTTLFKAQYNGNKLRLNYK